MICSDFVHIEKCKQGYRQGYILMYDLEMKDHNTESLNFVSESEIQLRNPWEICIVLTFYIEGEVSV